jgi:transcriptional regulator GlxA family with amidase domain
MTAAADSGKIRVQIIIFDGFDELDAIGVYEPLRMADFDVQLVSLRAQAHGLKVIPDHAYDPKRRPDLLCVPGGGWLAGAPQGARAEAERGEILAVLRDCHDRGIVIAAVCTGALLLGRAGLLKERHATTNHSVLEELRDAGALVMDSRVVDTGDLITAGGITSGLDLGLWLIQKYAGINKAVEISGRLEFELRGPVWQSGARTN